MILNCGYLREKVEVMSMTECLVTVIAILVIAALAGFAMSKGEDGTMLLTAIAAIAGLAGYQMGRTKPR